MPKIWGVAENETYAAKTDEAAALAERFGLLPSGGSDFHGAAKPAISLGTGKGDLCVPFGCYEALRDFADNNRPNA